MSALPSPAKMTAIRAVFTAMFDAVETMGEFDEDKWVDMIAAFNATGRLVFGWPHLESSESDIFGALDEIAMQLDATKNAITETTKDARIVLYELSQAVGGVPEAEPEAAAPPPRVEEAPSRVDPGADKPVAVPDLVPPNGPPYATDPVRPSVDDERMFGVVRQLGDRATYGAIERALGMQPSRAYARFALLAGYNTLPEDMVAFRESRKTKTGPLAGVPDDVWEPLCMDKADFDAWKGHNVTLKRVSGGKNVARRPCADCPLSYATEMRASGKCNGEPGLAA